ncbi:MAG: flagellar biosynthetic protein FliQ [Alphaproteobacteria bacterium]
MIQLFMTPEKVGDILREAILVVLKTGGPLMITTLVVGIFLSLIQALIQIQEPSFIFVPKLLILFIAIVFLMPFINQVFISFSQELFSMIAIQ